MQSIGYPSEYSGIRQLWAIRPVASNRCTRPLRSITTEVPSEKTAIARG